MPAVRIYKTPEELAGFMAEELAVGIRKAAARNKVINIALSGGTTPGILFSVLAAKYARTVDWRYVRLFWVDERCVPPGHSDSNFGMAKRLLTDKINIPENNIHRMRGEAEPEEEADRYSREILSHVKVKRSFPAFDIMLLGMGDDGHTASIFPGNERLLVSAKICETAVHPVTGQKRITLTGKVINNSKEIFFLVTGVKKSGVVNQIFSKSGNYAMFPASHIKAVSGKTTWLIDEEAANNLH